MWLFGVGIWLGGFGACLTLLVAYSFAVGVSGFVVICGCGYFVTVVVCGCGNVGFYVGLALRIWWFGLLVSVVAVRIFSGLL